MKLRTDRIAARPKQAAEGRPPSPVKPLFSAILLVVATTAWGCQTPRIVRELERENRELENKIWELAGLLEDKQAELEACRGRDARPESGGTGTVAPRRAEAAPVWPGRAEPPPLPGRDGLPGIEIAPPMQESSPERALPGSGPPTTAPGAFIPPDSSTALPQFPETTQDETPSRAAGTTSASPVSRQEPAFATGRVREGRSDEVTAVLLHPDWVRGIDLDGRPGDDGIQILLQPTDERGDIPAAAAPISVVVLDPRLSGWSARIARWDLLPDEVRSYFVQRDGVAGYLLDLPWPAEPPVHRELIVVARYTTADGRKLEAQAELNVRPVTSVSWSGN